jgi:hypothetical protein
MFVKRTGVILLLVVLAGASAVALAGSGYRVLKKIPIPGDYTWDYVAVDGVNRRVYISHGEQTEVLDADSDAVVGKISAPRTDPSNK